MAVVPVTTKPATIKIAVVLTTRRANWRIGLAPECWRTSVVENIVSASSVELPTLCAAVLGRTLEDPDGTLYARIDGSPCAGSACASRRAANAKDLLTGVDDPAPVEAEME